ncbi:unnamed protein product [Clavelina lepadiformis]|uniref:Maturase K n=1 Tax=Clavelina lepadiformis TaxID=159417 RepID=A0ABP0G2F1_CLALP
MHLPFETISTNKNVVVYRFLYLESLVDFIYEQGVSLAVRDHSYFLRRNTVFRIIKVCPPGLHVYNWFDKLRLASVRALRNNHSSLTVA